MDKQQELWDRTKANRTKTGKQTGLTTTVHQHNHITDSENRTISENQENKCSQSSLETLH